MITIEKVYPIEGRKDFFKYVLKDKNGNIKKDYQGKEMYFDEWDLDNAKSVKKSIETVNQLNDNWI